MQFDLDQEGNVHILIHWGWDDDKEDESYMVDGVVYARDSGVGDDDFTVVGGPEYLDLLADPPSLSPTPGLRPAALCAIIPTGEPPSWG